MCKIENGLLLMLDEIYLLFAVYYFQVQFILEILELGFVEIDVCHFDFVCYAVD